MLVHLFDGFYWPALPFGLPKSIASIAMYIRLGKTGSLGPWSRVMVCFAKMILPKDPVLSTLMYMHNYISTKSAISKSFLK
jgi:hypothetical protein